MKHDDEERLGNGHERLDDQDQAVSDLVVRVNEPDIYTPTLDLSDDPSQKASQELLRQAATRPGLRRAIRTNENHQLELAPIDEQAALEELQKEVENYNREVGGASGLRSPWVFAFVAVLLAMGFVLLFGARK